MQLIYWMLWGWWGGAPSTPEAFGLEYTAPTSRMHYTAADARLHYTAAVGRLHYAARSDE